MEKELLDILADEIGEIFNDMRLSPTEKRDQILSLIRQYQELDDLRKSFLKQFLQNRKKRRSREIGEDILGEHDFISQIGLIAAFQMLQVLFPKENYFIPYSQNYCGIRL